MIIKCLFIRRKENSMPEFVVAWDEYSIEKNPGGFEEACQVVRKDYDPEHDCEFRTVEIAIPDDTIQGLFDTLIIEADIA